MLPRNRFRWALIALAPTSIRVVRITAALVGLFAVGCTLNKDQFRAEAVLARLGGTQGKIIEPKRCLLEVAILTRPMGDKALNDSVWNVADVQCVPDETRRALDSNGVRVGKIIGALPPDLESVFHARPPHKVTPVSFLPENGEPISIRVAENVPELSLLMNRDGRAIAKDYELASGFFRATAEHEGERGVKLRVVPEIHYGPVKQTFQGIASNPGAYPINHQLTMTNSQQQDSIIELAATMVVQPGEMAVLGCDPEKDRTLGSFLFTFLEANSDRRMQHLVLIWASRNQSGTIEAEKLHSATERPKDSQTLKAEAKSSDSTTDNPDSSTRRPAATDKPVKE